MTLKISFTENVFLCAAALALALLGEPRVHAQPAIEAWVQRYHGSAIFESDAGDAQKMVVDFSGNVILAGFIQYDGEFNLMPNHGLVMQYSNSGVLLWTNLGLSGSANALAVDANGNVIVAGYYGTNGYTDATYGSIKYSTAGVPLWTNLGPGGSASAAAVDGSGNVFVTGSLFVTNGIYPYATIGYSSAGVPLWTNLYTGPLNYEDRAAALGVDSSGNVFVTVYGANTFGAHATIKYSGHGVPLWTNLYNGPWNSDDRTIALAVDDSGNVVVTGDSYGSNGTVCATVKYSGAGVALWTNPCPTGSINTLAVDGGGNVFATGNLLDTNGSSTYATIKYSSAGVPLWTNLGPSGNVLALAADGSGSVLVTGYPATIKYSNAGIPVWTNSNIESVGDVLARALAADSNGNVFVTGSGSTTVAYSGAGVPLWTNRYVASIRGGANEARAVAVDSNGNVVVTGNASGTDGTSCATIKYSNAGVALWTNLSPVQEVSTVALDGSGNVVVTGSSYDANGADYATIKYSGAGVPLWTNRYNGPGNHDDQALALAVDSSGSVLVTGSSYDTNISAYATIKYSGAGVPLWTNRYRGTGYQNDGAYAVAVDAGGNVFVTGSSYNSSRNYDYATIKYSGAGVALWTNLYQGRGDQNDAASSLVVDNNGNVVVTGHSHNGSDYDYATIKYSGAGVPLWVNRYVGPTNGDDIPTAVAVDGSGNVVVTGNSATTSVYPYNDDYATIKYSSAGVPLWTNRYRGLQIGGAEAKALAVDSNGNVFVTGNLYSTNGDLSGCATLGYSSAGVPLWTNLYPNASATALTVDGRANVYVTGSLVASDGSSDYLTIKYSPAGVPLLKIARTTTNTVTVSWPSLWTGWNLQVSTNLTTPNWSTPGETLQDNGTIKFIISSPVGNSFYRLKQM